MTVGVTAAVATEAPRTVAARRWCLRRSSTAPATPTAKPVSAEWARGEYLVRGLGHCAACHSPRNAWGATRGGGNDLQGGLLPLQQWYAPALTSSAEAGVAHWKTEDVVALLRTGQAPAQQASVSGPMADVVFNST